MNQGVMKLVGFVFNQLVAQKFLTGHRSYIAGAMSILGGIVVIGDMVVNGQFDEVHAGAAWASIALGYKIIGDAGKKQALIDATAAAAAK